MFGFWIGLILLLIISVFLWLLERKIARSVLMLKKCQIATREMPVCEIASVDNNYRPILVNGYTRRGGGGPSDSFVMDGDTGFFEQQEIPILFPMKKEVIRLMRRGE